MDYYDYHIHSKHSFDGSVEIDTIVKEALRKGMSGVTMTEHVEFVGLYEVDLLPDIDAYRLDVANMQKKYPDFKIGMGIELGLQSGLLESYSKISQAAEWDFIIGSVHYLHGGNLHTGEFSAGKSKGEAWHEYLVALRKLVEEVPYFDVLGHLDLLRRDTTLADRTLSWQEFGQEIDELLLALISHGKGLEVNTGALRYGLPEPHPVSSILSRYHQLGGEIVTCGSDAHLQESVCQDIPLAYEYIKAAGFKYISLFDNRKVRQMPLD